VALRLPPLFRTAKDPKDVGEFDPSQARNYILWPKLADSRSPYPNSCCEPWSRIVVAANGDARPCCVWPYPVGNLIEQPFEEVWNGPGFQKVRRRVNTRFPQSPCKDCTLWYGINAGRKETVEAGLPFPCRLHTTAQRWFRRLKERPGEPERR
jgi:radical SAM protein with 4Fe4S-binding SPASM domain